LYFKNWLNKDIDSNKKYKIIYEDLDSRILSVLLISLDKTCELFFGNLNGQLFKLIFNDDISDENVTI
jgi:hypothetical protein